MAAAPNLQASVQKYSNSTKVESTRSGLRISSAILGGTIFSSEKIDALDSRRKNALSFLELPTIAVSTFVEIYSGSLKKYLGSL
ncbi:hypothetical protein WAI453_013020 [Rhynchosporium graminicola]